MPDENTDTPADSNAAASLATLTVTCKAWEAQKAEIAALRRELATITGIIVTGEPGAAGKATVRAARDLRFDRDQLRGRLARIVEITGAEPAASMETTDLIAVRSVLELRDERDALREQADVARHAAEPLPDGEWRSIAFMGHIEYDGFVREVTRNGQPAYRVELPDYVWGGDPSAVRHHAASAWFGDQPVSEESVRKAWEARRELAEQRRLREEEWQRQQERRALEPAGTSSDDGDPWSGAAGAPF